MTNGISPRTNVIPSEVALSPCPLCGKKVSIARSDNEQGERWWSVTRGTCKTTRCNCRLFLESEKFTCGWNDAHALECRRKLIERWNARADVAEMAQRIQSLELECAKLAEELREAGNRGECEMVTSGTPSEGNTDKRCTACGAYNIGEYYDGLSHIASPRFCPNCGRAVKR